MASAGPEAYNLGLKKGSQFQVGISSGLSVPPLTAKLHESKSWYLANQPVKPIWQLEHNNVSSLQDKHQVHSGISCQRSRLLYPESLCGEAVLQSPPPPQAQTLPNFLGSTLLYRRSYFRHKPYRRLDSICLQPSTLEKKPFRIPPPVYRSIPNNVMSSSTMDPFLVPSTVGDRSSPVSKGFPLNSGKQSSSSYKPVLNNNSFLRPTSAKVPLQHQHPQPPESKKLKSLLRPPGFSWTHSGGTGDSCPVNLERKFAKSNGLALEQASAKSHLPAHNGTVLKTERPSWRLEDGENRSQNLKEQDVRLTEAMRKLTASGIRKVGTYNEFGHRIDSSCLMNASFHPNLFSRWRPHIVAQISPKEVPAATPPNLELSSRHQSLTGTETADVCTKRISIRLLAPNPEPSNLSTLCKSATPPPMNSPEPTVKTELPPQATITEVETKISSLQLNTDTKLVPPITVKDTE